VSLLFVASDFIQAQIAKDSWAFGFGLRYPRYVGVQVRPTYSNYGAYVSLQRNFSEHFGVRLKTSFSHLEGEWQNSASATITESTNLISSDLDMMFYLIPCEPVSPYLYAGVGLNYRMLNNPKDLGLTTNEFGAEWNAGLGVEWTVVKDWKIVTEFGFHGTSSSELDGFVSPNGSDNLWAINVGALYYFALGNPSTLCQPLPSGVAPEAKDMTDYNKIEAMIVKHIPKEVTKEVVVDRYIKAISDDRLVLVGVNFAFDKSDLLPESYKVLDQAVDLLEDNPNVNVEIEGYTDYIDTETYNQKLSEERAQTVKNYLVSKGIAENRLSTIGYGENNPIADNSTAEGRALNRRIVFRIIK
jgi:OOP family OmpA-OmpF porin